MYCEVCGRSGGHLPNCPENPNYEENEFIPTKNLCLYIIFSPF